MFHYFGSTGKIDYIQVQALRTGGGSSYYINEIGVIHGNPIVINYSISGFREVPSGAVFTAINTNSSFLHGTATQIGCYSDSYRLALGYNGTVYAAMASAGGTWATISDRRDKTDFKPISNSLKFINKLDPITYRSNRREEYIDVNGNFDSEGYEKLTSAHDRRISGFIAQDVYQSMKDVYNGDDNYANLVDYTRYNDSSVIEDRYYMNYTSLIPFLTGAIQELSKEVDSLKATIAELKSQSTNQ